MVTQRISQHRRRARRGFIHLLFLVFVVLGVTMWGVSELQQFAKESKQDITATSGDSLAAAKQALFNYALLPPEILETNNDPGRYNAYSDSGDKISYNYFSLPCPDVALSGDTNLDGLSDILERPCSDSQDALQSGSRFGRLPWRGDKTVIGGDFEYVRGLGDIDFRDGYGNRLWYGVSRNVVDSETLANPHALVRLTTGWITVMDTGGNLVSDRVAAVVVAPGPYGDENVGTRVGEDLLYAGDTAAPAVVNTPMTDAYLAEETFIGFSNGSDVITINTAVTDDPSIDRVEYLTIDELAGEKNQGINILENAPENIYDVIEGDGNYLSAVELLSEHLERYGFLPEPAVLDESLITLRSRPSGAPAQTSIDVEYAYDVITTTLSLSTVTLAGPPITTVTSTTTLGLTLEVTVSNTVPFQQGAKVDTSTSGKRIMIRLSDLPPVYLVGGAELNITVDQSGMDAPYGADLAVLETALNSIALTPAKRTQMIANDDYPTRGIGGLDNDMFDVDFLAEAAPPITINTNSTEYFQTGNRFVVALADTGYGYFIDELLTDSMSYPNGKSPDDIAKLPPYAGKVLLPTGTRLTLRSDDILLRLPSTFNLPPGSALDPVTGFWILTEGSDVAVQVIAGDSKFVITELPPNATPVVAGDMGLLPVESAMVQDDNVGATVGLSHSSNAVTRLAIDTEFAANTDMTLVPFAPPGRPTTKDTDYSLMTPYRIAQGTRFIVPARSHIIYPQGGEFIIGDNFNFPDDSILQFHSGAVVTVDVYRNGILPGGIALNNSAIEQRVVTLSHGGVIRLQSVSMAPDQESSEIISPVQKLLDVELRGTASVGGLAVDEGHIIRPFLNRRLVAPPRVTVANAVFSADSYVRAGFVTRPRYVRIPMPQRAGASHDDIVAVSPDNDPIFITNLRGVSNIDQFDDLYSTLTLNPTVTMSYDEDTHFYIPPNKPVSLTVTTFVAAGKTITAMRSVHLPRNTGIFDVDARPQFGNLTIVSGEHPQFIVMSDKTEVTLVHEVDTTYTYTVGAATLTATVQTVMENRLVLYPETDMYMHINGTVSLVAAGSIVDLLAGEISAPSGVQRIHHVASDVGLSSRGAAYMYLNASVTLLADLPHLEVEDGGAGVSVTETHTGRVQARYVSYADYVTSGGASPAVVGSLDITPRVILPADTYIQIPQGRAINFLSPDSDTTVALTLAEYDHLPPGAVAIIPLGREGVVEGLSISINLSVSLSVTINAGITSTITSTITTAFTTAMTTTLEGPAYINLADENGAVALVNLDTHFSGNPLIFLTEDAYLSDHLTEGSLRHRIHSSIPSIARLDIYGNMERRLDSGFYSELMPPDSRTFFEEFPLLYAVAPECRRGESVPGGDCAEGDREGLVFELTEGEEYVLTEPYDANMGGIITAAYTGVDMEVDVMNIGSTVVRDNFTSVEAIYIDGYDGSIDMDGAAYTPRPNDKIIIRVNGNNLQTELRAYLSPTVILGDDLSDNSYVAVNGTLTLYSGGVLGTNYISAGGQASVALGNTVTYGVGADLLEISSGDKIFGDESEAVVVFENGGGGYTATVSLKDYVYSGQDGYDISVSLSSDAVDVDQYGGAYIEATVGEMVPVISRDVNLDAVLAGDELVSIINVAAGETIPMEQGYLWQGYLPVMSALEIAQNTVMMSAYTKKITRHYVNWEHNSQFCCREHDTYGEQTTITTSVFPDNKLHVRVQSTITVLNGFGSGLERPESIDADSYTFFQQSVVADGSVANTSYHSYGVGRHYRYDEHGYQYPDYFLWALATNPYRNRYQPASNKERYTANTSISPPHYERGYSTFAVLMDGTVVSTTLGVPFYDPVDRRREQLTMQVRVHNKLTGESQLTLAAWAPIVVSNNVTVTGYIRVNSGSSSPIANTEDDFSVARVWERKLDAGGPVYYDIFSARLLPFEWMGRSNRTGAPEDGIIDGFMCNGAADAAVFNIPHTNIAGTRTQFRLWRFMEHRDHAYMTNFGDDFYRSSDGVSQGVVLDPDQMAFNAANFAPRAAYSPIAYSTLYAQDPGVFQTGDASNPANHYSAGYDPYELEVNASAVHTMEVESDLVFYMDSAYHSDADDVYSPVPQQTLYFGDDFMIHGPSALVPPFGGNTQQATQDALAARSQMLDVFPDFTGIGRLYDGNGEACRGGSERCEAMYKNTQWFPAAGGVVTFNGLQAKVTDTGSYPGGEDVRLIMPQPQALVEDIDGNTVTVYAGSAIYPRQRSIVSARPIPEGDYTLESIGEVVAYVDVSPVHREVNNVVRHRKPQQFDSGIFNWAPAASGSGNCIVEPLGFVTAGPVLDFDPRAVMHTPPAPVVYTPGSYRNLTNVGTKSAVCDLVPSTDLTNLCTDLIVSENRANGNPMWHTFGSVHDAHLDRQTSSSPVVRRSNGHFTIGLLGWMDRDEDAVNLLNNGVVKPHMDSLRDQTYEPLRYDGGFNRGFYADDDGLALLTAYYSGEDMFTNAKGYTVYAENSSGSGSAVLSGQEVTRNTDVPFGNPAAYHWVVGGAHTLQIGERNLRVGNTNDDIEDHSSQTVQVRFNTDGEEFNSLRLAHRIVIAASVTITVNSFDRDQNGHTPAHDADKYFTFPVGSEAFVLNNDVNSWLSANPYLGLYQNGITISLLDGSSVVDTQVIPEQNDAYHKFDISERHVVHYTRSNPSQHREPLSNAPLYTNVWLRVVEGGVLRNQTNNSFINLSPGSLVNPVLGTYLHNKPHVGGLAGELKNGYRSDAVVHTVPMRIARPALTLPAGARVVTRANGGIIRNVKAAVFFSISPLDEIDCPAGNYNLRVGQVDTVALNQLREGITENRYDDSSTGRLFGVSHPCAILDDPENMDGDRTFIYRGRRRYVDDDIKINSASNDRTYLLGGRLFLN